MGRRGRPRKAGRRTKGDRLARDNYAEPDRIPPSEWVKAQYARFGQDYCWALGRAYAAGLLGEGVEAKSRFDAAKRFVRLYRRFIGGDAYTCPLDSSPRGGNVVELYVSDHQKDDHKWLFTAMDAMDVAGVRPYFDALITTLNTDSGPFWLDALLNGGKHPADRMLLQAAIRALDIIAPEVRPMGIRAVAS